MKLKVGNQGAERVEFVSVQRTVSVSLSPGLARMRGERDCARMAGAALAFAMKLSNQLESSFAPGRSLCTRTSRYGDYCIYIYCIVIIW